MGRRLCLLFSLIIYSIGVIEAKKVSITPVPLLVEEGCGVFRITPSMSLYTNLDSKTKTLFREHLCTGLGLKEVVNSSQRELSNLVFLLVDKLDPQLTEEEAYKIEVTQSQIIVTSTTDRGLFYAIQTLAQVVDSRGDSRDRTIPTFMIKDQPRFKYRGFMLDVSRHFFSKAFIKKQIDAMAFLKLNKLHLHLTDAAGWRIEIQAYPKLTTIAAWRDGANWKSWWNGSRQYARQTDKGSYGGYYTKEDIRELIAYANKRFITIIPEIEMPGHSEEVLAVYPELACPDYLNKSGDYCVGNEETFNFLKAVLSEVIELFPSRYIHIGGDEAGKSSWKTCPKCIKRMQEEKLENVEELQGYFIKRIGDFLSSKDRKLLGWDELLDSGLGDGTTVMTWRGVEKGVAAVKSGHHTVMTPGEFCYFDAYQDAPYTQPEAIGGYLPLKKVYNYDPVPSGLSLEESALIDGVQANLWTEYIPTEGYAERMMYPRLFALAEVAWSKVENKEYLLFLDRSLQLIELFKQRGYNPFELSEEVGERVEVKTPIDHLGVGKRVIYNAPYSDSYPAAGEQALTDGLRGGWTYGDKRWQGFISKNRLDVVIDLEKEEDIHAIYADIIQSPGAEVYFPEFISIKASSDGLNYVDLFDKKYIVEKDSQMSIKKYGWKGEIRARYIRFSAQAGTSLGGWIFTDEIVIK